MKTKLLLLIIFIISQNIHTQTKFIDHIITQDITTGNSPLLVHIFSADIDLDGDMDVISASGNSGSNAKVTWYENTDGLGNFGNENLIFDNTGNTLATRYRSVYASDFDGDGDIDVFAGSSGDDKVVWFENLDGKGSFGNEIIISTDLSGCYSIITGDLDNDGDEDVIYTSSDNDEIFWQKNTDSKGAVSGQIIIDNNAELTTDLIAKDIDGDGDLDLVASLPLVNKVVWYENTDGLGTFSSQKIITSDGFRYSSVFAEDIDGDGDLDIISGSTSGSSSVAWYENLDGKGNFGAQNLMAESMKVDDVVATDLDMDGDIDIISAHQGSGESVRWFENLDGKGSFSSYKLVSTETSYAESLFLADIDSDGVIDILSTDKPSHLIKWHENVMVSNKINGRVLFDVNNDGCDNADLIASNIKVITKNSVNSITTFTNKDGLYELFPPDEGDYSVHVDVSSSLFSSNPDEYNFNFVGNVTTENADFCLEAVKVVNDVSMVLFNIGRRPVPGFEVKYQMYFRNNGTSVLNGIIVLQFNNNKLEFVSSTDTTSSQTDSSLSFGFSNLNPFEGRFIDIVFNVFEPPITIADDILIFTAKITPAEGDDNEADNEVVPEFIVFNSHDPNDISVLEGEQISIEQIDNFLHYVIRFQNVGSIEATNVRVENILDANLDWDSFQIENMSHNNRVELRNGNEVSFIFDDIFLADSTSNEPESHGYIAYKIKPKENITIGEIMNNDANIFFDYNAAVETNTVTTKVATTLSVSQNSLTDFSVFPIPATDLLQVQSKTNIYQILIYNYFGQLILSHYSDNDSNNKIIDISNIEPGLYFLNIKDENGANGIKKIIKN